MKKWRILSLILVLILVASNSLPTSVLAQDGAQVEGSAAAGADTEAAPEKKTEKEDTEEEKEPEEEVHVTSISISRSSLSLMVGDTASLSAEVSPGDARDCGISWSSSDSGIASVNSSGKVNANSAGTARITATSDDGGLSADCTVTVSEKQEEETLQPDSSDTEENKEDKNSDDSEDASSGTNKNQDAGKTETSHKSSSKKASLSSAAQASSSVKPKDNEDQAAYRTALADGTYTDFDYVWTGGTGKAKLTLTKIIVSKGIASGVFTASSASMTHVYYAGHTNSDEDDPAFYDPDSDTCGQDVLPIKNQKVTFPVVLNKKTDLACRSTAMSVPHWIQYAYTITISEPDICKVKIAGENEDGESVSISPEVKDSTGKTIKADSGFYSLDRKASYSVTASAEGYKDWQGTITPSQDGETVTLILEAEIYDVKIKATDEDSGKEIDNVSITVTDEKTGAEIEASGGNYPFIASHTYTIVVAGGDDYEDAKKENVSADKDKTIEIPLKAIDPETVKKYDLTVLATDEDGRELTDAVVDVSMETSDQSIHVKPVDGKYSLISKKNYTVTVSATGYESLTRVVQLSKDSTETFQLKKQSFPIHVRVIEQATEYNLSKATLTVKDSQGKTYSGQNNTFSVPYLTSLTITASYTGYETPDGAATASRTLTVTGEDTITLALVKKTFPVKVTAVNAQTGKAVSGAKFTVTDSSTGKTVSAKSGAYPLTYTTIYTIAASASGFAGASVTHKCTSAATVTVKMTPTGNSGSGGSSSGGSSSTTEKTEKVVNNGTYNIKFKDAENSMFNVVGAILHVKNGKYTADISLSGTGYDYVYPSTAAAARKAGKSKWSKFWKNSKGQYTYTIEVPYLDKPFILASRSIKYANDPEMKDQAWRDGLESGGSHGSHEIILYSKYTNGKNLPTHNGTRQASSITPATDKSANKSSNKASNKTSSKGKGTTTKKKGTTATKYKSNTGGGTGSVNNNTGLADGTYKPDSFSFSGGTGKVRITCDRIIVKGGKTYARITFSSTYFQYVKAGGKKITDYTRTSTSTSFVIPCQLNKNNKILGMTTKMSQPHEIAYTLYIGLNAAKTAGTGTGTGGTAAGDTSAAGTGTATATTSGKVDDQYAKLDAQAPEIIGLTYKGEVPVTYSDKIKIFEYQDGFLLVELDVRKGTALDSGITGIDVSTAEENKDTAASTQAGTGSTEASEQASTQAAQTGGDEEGAPLEKTASEQKAALYDNAVYKYLIVPEQKDVPAGIEKQLFVVQLPADKTVVTSPKALETLDKLKLYDSVMGIGMPKKDIKAKAFKDAMRKKNGKKARILEVGSYDKLDYRQLLLNKANVLLESPEILPHLGELKGFPQKTKEDFAKMTDQEKQDFEKAARKQALKLKTIGMRGVQLGMGVIVDRSADEDNALAKAEWLKLYGILYGKTSETDAMYKKVVDNASEEEKKKAAVASPSDKKEGTTETEAETNTETGEEVQ